MGHLKIFEKLSKCVVQKMELKFLSFSIGDGGGGASSVINSRLKETRAQMSDSVTYSPMTFVPTICDQAKSSFRPA